MTVSASPFLIAQSSQHMPTLGEGPLLSPQCLQRDDEGHSDTRCITRKDFERFLRDAELTVVTDVFERCAGEDKLMDPFQVLLRS